MLAALAVPVRADSVDDYLRTEMSRRHIPGLSVAVVRDGKVVKVQGYGLADVKAKTPASPETVYEIASLTKQFTAAAILTLAQQGKLGTEDPVSKYIPDTPEAWRGLTLRMLLNQTSGLPNYGDGLDGAGWRKTYSEAAFVRLAAARPLHFPPGTRFEYSNTNYHLLGLVIEKAGGKAYGDYLHRTFWGPLGMTATRLYGEAAPGKARGYLWDGRRVLPSRFQVSPTLQIGDSGVLSTVGDLAKWSAALDGDALLTPASKALLWTPPTLPSGASTRYAAGWIAALPDGRRLLWHNGALSTGFSGAFLRFPDDKLTVVALTNLLDLPGLQNSQPMYALTLGLARQALPGLAPPPVADTDPQTAALLRVVSGQLARGALDKSLFSPAMQAVLTPEAVDPARALLAPLGELTALTLLRREADGTALYRAVYGGTVVNWQIAVDKDHKITGLRPQPE